MVSRGVIKEQYRSATGCTARYHSRRVFSGMEEVGSTRGKAGKKGHWRSGSVNTANTRLKVTTYTNSNKG